MSATALATIAAYTAYAVEDHSQDFGTDLLPVTIPFCLFGLMRFFRLSGDSGNAHSPTEQITRDVPFLLNLGSWGILVILMIYVL